MKAARWAPLSGIISVALWIAALSIMLGSGVDTKESDSKILAYYRDDGHLSNQILGFFLILGACMFFVWFLSVLRGRIARAEGGGGTLTALAFGSGLVTTGLWVVAAGLWAVVADTLQETDRFVLDPNSYRLVGGLGYMIFVAGAMIALVLVAATSLAAVKTGFLPKWLGWVGFVVAASLVVSFAFVPFFALLGWVLVVSVVLIWKPAETAAVAAAG